MGWIDLAQEKNEGRFLVNTAMSLQFPEIVQNFLNS